jgi:ABC-type nitrate/sulfonate/bicarbonate transport system permease component
MMEQGSTGYPRHTRALLGIALPITLLIAWEAYGHVATLPSYLVPPSTIVTTIWEMMRSGELWLHSRDSLGRAMAGYALGAVCGTAMGLLAGIARPVERFYEPIISLTYPVPKIVVLPVLIAWLGAGDASKIAIITAAVFYPTFINALYGAKAVDRLLVWSGRNMGATPVQVFLKIVLPSALPQVLVGLRIALALAFIVVVASEMANSRTGLGHLIITAEDNIRFDLMYAAIVAVALIGFSGDRLLAIIRRRALLGRDAAREA